MIPMCFEEYNKMQMFGALEEGKFRYAFRLSGELADGQPGYASRCVRCGECLDKRPQHIQIPGLLAEVAKDFADANLPDRVAAARRLDPAPGAPVSDPARRNLVARPGEHARPVRCDGIPNTPMSQSPSTARPLRSLERRRRSGFLPLQCWELNVEC